MEQALLKRLNAARRAREAVMHVIDLASGDSRVIAEGESADGMPDSAIAAAFRSGRAGVAEAGGRLIFMPVP